MAFKLALTAGHYLYTAGKRCLKSIDPAETREWWLNDRIVDRIQALLADYDGIEILRTDDTTGKTEVELEDRVAKANKFKADFYLSVHHNAGANGTTAGGIQAYAYTNASQTSFNWQKDLYNELINLTGLKGNRAVTCPKSGLYEVKYTNMPAVLLELGFMDSTLDVPIILTQDYAYKCAQACVNVIVSKAGLKKKATPTASGATYKVVTAINRYASVADAKAKTNSKGKYEAGTYYIYNKYPDGVNGMLNISTDKTGASAGSWINPKENVIKESTTTTEVKKLYRVRKSKDDAASQKGAFSELANAKDCCQEAGAGYHVFDWDYKIVYSYIAPVETPKPTPEPTPSEPTPTEPTKEVAVYELDYKEKTKIIEKDVSYGNSDTNCTKAIKKILSNNSSFNVEIAKCFFELAPKYFIDPMMVIAQSILETGWFKFAGSSVSASQNNFCGLGATGGGAAGAAFTTVEDGVRAQLQHLYAYGCKDNLPAGETVVDPRYSLVTRGIAPYWQQLAGRWACPGWDKNTYATPAEAMAAGNTYGQKIRTIYTQLCATSVTEEEVQKYFPAVSEEPSIIPT